MTEREIELIHTSWEEVKPLATQFGEVFYYRLFEYAPHFRGLFTRGSLFSQQRKFVSWVNVLVANVGNLDRIASRVDKSAVRFIRYGVSKGHYGMIENVFLATLQQALGNEWDDELEAAWRNGYRSVVDKMMKVYSKEDKN